MLDTSLAGSDLSSRFLHPGRCQQPFQGRHPHGLVLARPILFPPEDQALCPERRDEPTIGVHPAMGCSTSNTYNQNPGGQLGKALDRTSGMGFLLDRPARGAGIVLHQLRKCPMAVWLAGSYTLNRSPRRVTRPGG